MENTLTSFSVISQYLATWVMQHHSACQKLHFGAIPVVPAHYDDLRRPLRVCAFQKITQLVFNYFLTRQWTYFDDFLICCRRRRDTSIYTTHNIPSIYFQPRVLFPFFVYSK